jgi:hypothetical protein
MNAETDATVRGVCRTYVFLAPKTGISDHQNSLAKNQNRLYAILERRVFKVRQTPETAATARAHPDGYR